MCRVVLLFAALSTSAENLGIIETKKQIADFERHWNPFVRDYFGCDAEGEVSIESCRPHKERVNYREYAAACHAAAKFFRLKDTCEDGR